MKHTLAILTYVLTLMLGISSAVTYYAGERARLSIERATSAEAVARTAIGKLYAYQEGEGDRLEAAEGLMRVELWKANEALEACKKGRT